MTPVMVPPVTDTTWYVCSEMPANSVNEQAHRVTGDHPERAQVEQWRAEPQQPVLQELAGVGGPAELIVPPPPDVPGDEHREAGVGQDDPDKGAHLHTSA
jgi:hypothetical protein